MPPLEKWPDVVKAVLTAIVASLATIFGMGLYEGARRERSDTDHAAIRDHGKRISDIELRLAADSEWKVNTTKALERIEALVRSK